MYDTTLTRQSLPSERYRLLLGTALSVFSSNNGFVIENILHTDDSYSWYSLIDMESGRLKSVITQPITAKAGEAIGEKFAELVAKRNRIIHGFRVTSPDDDQVMATKVKGTGEQFYITEEYLTDFICENERLSDMLYEYRGY